MSQMHMSLPRSTSVYGELRAPTTARLGGVLSGVGSVEAGTVLGYTLGTAFTRWMEHQ
jgi:hypothetical protein